MAENPQPPPRQFVDVKTGLLTENAFRWLERQAFSTGSSVGSIISGQTQLAAQQAAQLAAEQTARIAGDAANATAGDGTGTTDATPFSGGVSSGASWVVIATTTITPSAAGGDYNFTITPDVYINGHLSDEGPAGAVFNGAWRIREEENGGGTPVTLASGTFTVTHTPESIIEFGEGGGGSITIPESWAVAFASLPSSPIATTYDSIMVDQRLEISRASGSNEITSPGLSGSMAVNWTP